MIKKTKGRQRHAEGESRYNALRKERGKSSGKQSRNEGKKKKTEKKERDERLPPIKIALKRGARG